MTTPDPETIGTARLLTRARLSQIGTVAPELSLDPDLSRIARAAATAAGPLPTQDDGDQALMAWRDRAHKAIDAALARTLAA